MTFPNFGAQLTLAGTQITNAYVFQTTPAYILGGRMAHLLYSVLIVGKASTAISPVKVKVQGSEDGTNWVDIATDDDTAEGTTNPTVEHSITVGSGLTVARFIVAKGRYLYLRVGVQGAAAGATGDSVVVSARAVGL